MGLGSAIGGAISAVGSLIGGKQRADSQTALNRQQYEYQKEFAQNGVRWKVADAKAAGIHPLYALGANTTSYSPVSSYGTDTGTSDAFASLGQGVGRAVSSMMTEPERREAKARQQMDDVFNLALRRQELELGDARVSEARLRNQILADQIATSKLLSQQRLDRTGRGPGMPDTLKRVMDGQAQSPYLDETIPEQGWVRDDRGRYLGVVPSSDLAERTEDKLVIEWLPWLSSIWRNTKGKLFGSEVAGRWWHGDSKGFLPYPPKRSVPRVSVRDWRFLRP